MADTRVKIYAYHTHYEIENYILGSNERFERKFSIYDEFYHEWDSYLYYNQEKSILYVPRGVDPEFISNYFGNKPIDGYVKECNPYKKISFSMKSPPRDEVQKESIRYLLGKNEHSYTKGSSQLILSLLGGGGKTYSAIASLSILETKAIVICHSDDVKKQWRSRIAQYTNIGQSSVISLDSSKQLETYINPDKDTMKSINEGIFFLTTHSLLHSFLSSHTMEDLNTIFINLGIGVKIIDEFHRNFLNTLFIDYATNVYKTYYLSATAGRSSKEENDIFQRSFDRVYKLKKTIEDLDREKKIIAIYNLFRSTIPSISISYMYNKSKFSVHKYTQAEIRDGTVIEKIKMWLEWLENRVRDDQFVFVLSSMKSSCDLLAKEIQKWYPNKKVCSYHSSNKIENIQDYDIVCSTVQMIGTGNDYQNLKAIINTEAYASAVTADQLVHRLDRGNADTGATYYIDLIDKKVPNARNMYKKRSVVIAQFVAKSLEMDDTVKK